MKTAFVDTPSAQPATPVIDPAMVETVQDAPDASTKGVGKGVEVAVVELVSVGDEVELAPGEGVGVDEGVAAQMMRRMAWFPVSETQITLFASTTTFATFLKRARSAAGPSNMPGTLPASDTLPASVLTTGGAGGNPIVLTRGPLYSATSNTGAVLPSGVKSAA